MIEKASRKEVGGGGFDLSMATSMDVGRGILFLAIITAL